MRYWAAAMVSGTPVIVTFLSVVPSSALAILIAAPDNCLPFKYRTGQISFTIGYV